MREKLKERRFIYDQRSHGRNYPVITIESAPIAGCPTEMVLVNVRGGYALNARASELTIDIPTPPRE
jgi:hypothetical protein